MDFLAAPSGSQIKFIGLGSIGRETLQVVLVGTHREGGPRLYFRMLLGWMYSRHILSGVFN
jgi:hypothetical protein